MKHLLALLTLLGACALPVAPPPALPKTGPGPTRAVHAVFAAEGGCSAVAIEPHVLVTAGHCVDAFKSTTVVLLGDTLEGAGTIVDATWRAPEPQDLALLHVPDALPYYIPIGSLPGAGDRLTLVGYGCDSGWPPWVQGVRGAAAFGAGGGLVLFNGVVCHGDSGGAILDRSGALVAVMVASVQFIPGTPEVNAGTLLSVALPGLLDTSWQGP